MHYTSADFRQKGKSGNTFDTITSKKSVFFFKFRFCGGLEGCSSAAPSPLGYRKDRTARLSEFALPMHCVISVFLKSKFCFGIASTVL